MRWATPPLQRALSIWRLPACARRWRSNHCSHLEAMKNRPLLFRRRAVFSGGSALGCNSHRFAVLLTLDAQHHDGADQTGHTHQYRRRRVIAKVGTHEARYRGGGSSAELMTGDDPAEDDRCRQTTEHIIGQTHGRRYGSDPVKSVEDRENSQAEIVETKSIRQEDQRDAAQTVIPEQQHAWIEAIRQPSRQGGADQIEHTHRRQDAGATDF